MLTFLRYLRVSFPSQLCSVAPGPPRGLISSQPVLNTPACMHAGEEDFPLIRPQYPPHFCQHTGGGQFPNVQRGSDILTLVTVHRYCPPLVSTHNATATYRPDLTTSGNPRKAVYVAIMQAG